MILVTGSTGLVGSHLLYHLSQKNDEILAMYRCETKKENVRNIFNYYDVNSSESYNKIKWVKSDVTDICALEAIFLSHKIKQVYHCAAIISFNPDDFNKMYRVNIEGTANIVNLCIDFAIDKLCYVSSIATFDTKEGSKFIDEECDWDNNLTHSPYAITKNGAEMEVWRASQENIDVIIVNPGVILGAGFNDGSSSLFTNIDKGLKFYTEGITGFVGVVDVVKSMLMLMNSDIKNERFIIVSENKIYKDILFSIADSMNKPRPNIKAGKIATSIFWRVAWFISKITRKEPLITKSSAKSAHSKDYYSSKKLISLFPDFKFEKISDTIKRVCTNNFPKK